VSIGLRARGNGEQGQGDHETALGMLAQIRPLLDNGAGHGMRELPFGQTQNDNFGLADLALVIAGQIFERDQAPGPGMRCQIEKSRLPGVLGAGR